MKKILILSAIILMAGSIRAQYSFQDINSQLIGKYIWGVAVDNGGNTVVTGQFYSTITFGSFTLNNSQSWEDGYIAKQAPDGSWLWAKNITLNKPSLKKACPNATSKAFINAVNTDASGNVYITGYFWGSISFGSITLVTPQVSQQNCSEFFLYIFTAKMSPSGAFLWAKEEGIDRQNIGNSVTTDVSGNVYTTGYITPTEYSVTSCFQGTVIYQYDIYVVKYSAAGTKLWEKKYTNNAHQCGKSSISGTCIVSDGANLYVSGHFWGTVNFGNNNIFTAGTYNLFVLKLDGNGNTLWARTATTTSYDGTYLLLDNNNQDLHVGGTYSGTATFGSTVLSDINSWNIPYLAKYSASTGNFSWAVTAGNFGYGRMFKHPDGNIGVEAEDSGPEGFALKEFSPSDGSFVTATIAVPNGDANINFDRRCSIVSIPNGFIHSINLQGSYDFGGSTISSTQSTGSSYSDLILVKYTTGSLSPEVISGIGGSGSSAQQKILIFPNPASGQITVQDNNGKMLGTVTIYDVSGRMVYSTVAGSSHIRIDIPQLSRGFYYLRSDQSSATVKFVKE